MKNVYFLVMFLLSAAFATNLHAQRMEILGIDPSGYPKIKGEVIIYDANGIQYKAYSKDNLKLIEGIIEREITRSQCPENITKFSAILTIDISKSMEQSADPSDPYGTSRMELAKSVAKVWINALDTTRAECAITSFNKGTFLNQDFTIHKSLLYAAINNPDSIYPFSGTNYNAAFLKDDRGRPGVLEVAKKAKYKRVIVFLTDGEHDQQTHGPVEYTEISALADSLDCTVYCLSLGMPMPDVLANLADFTGGRAFAGLTSEETVKKLYLDILKEASNIGSSPCDFEFETDCFGGGLLKLSCDVFPGLSTTFQYTIPDKYKPKLEISPNTFYFHNKYKPETPSQDVRIYARNGDVTLDSYISDLPKYSIDWQGHTPPVKIKKDEFIDVKIVYNPANDSSYSIAKNFRFIGSSCSGNEITPSAGYILTHDVDMGVAQIEVSKEEDFSQVICNRSGKKIVIDRIEIIDDPDLEFWVMSPVGGFSLEHGKCQLFRFKFNPHKSGVRNAKIKLYSGSEEYIINIKGFGTGKAAIQAVNNIQFESLLCGNSTAYKDTLIYIDNIGWLDLEVSSLNIEGVDFNDFELPDNPSNFVIPAFERDSVIVRFAPKSKGMKNAILKINSNAENYAEYGINLTGKKDTVELSCSENEINLGWLCPGEVRETLLNVSNIGTIPVNITYAVDNGDFRISGSSATLLPETSTNISITFTSNVNGTYHNNVLSLFTDECGYQYSCALKAQVEAPEIKAVTFSMHSTVGVETDTTITIENTSNRDLLISELYAGDSRFTIVEPQVPVMIKANDSIKVKIKYLPKDDKSFSTHIYLKGDPCGFSDSIMVAGNSLLASAGLSIGKYYGLVGEVIQIPVLLANKKMFAESGASTIDLDISFYDCLLEPVAPTPMGVINGNYRTISFKNINVSGNSDETPITLNLLVKDCLNFKTSPLDIEKPKAGGAFVSFGISEGLFTLKEASATISTATLSASPGETINLPIFLSNTTNVTSFHDEIEFYVSFSGDVLEPVNPSPDDIFSGGDWKVKAAAPARESKNPSEIKTIPLRAMLGKTLSCPIIIESVSVKTGKVEFTEVSGTFTLSGICESGGLRLFDSKGVAGIAMVKPNPVGNILEIEYDVLEQGFTKLSLIDLNGSEMAVISANVLSPGRYLLQYDTGKLSSGIYYLIYQTPTQRFTEKVFIVK